MANTRRLGLPGFPPVVRGLIIINLVVWLLEISSAARGQWIILHLALFDFQSPLFQPYQYLTYMFVHDNVSWQHVFFNMFALWMFGSTLEIVWGSRRFFYFYMICGIGAAVLYTGIMAVLGNHTAGAGVDSVMYGASGAVFGVLVAFGYTFPNAEMIILPIPFPIKAKWLVAGYVVVEFFLGVARLQGDNVAHFAHLTGALVGFLLVYFQNRRLKRRRQDLN
ncbi:MAG TPA: rhomboid family intramembrane serine protease [Dinghuibacter sp.]|jgi:membrane associated rhomboid family serine protease|uniref:rhomboid family intramembrane serine protease n=1 Tax=Dinghuibacter sp. TaxID=2024697 RepID=UPI002C5BE10F|nr:rhomboid family intramembrane serine protease [Dinghuibacter sp.]HTJ10720.1 rhomboid family intramembrane serine protease [Dinghuibacter sp.]